MRDAVYLTIVALLLAVAVLGFTGVLTGVWLPVATAFVLVALVIGFWISRHG